MFVKFLLLYDKINTFLKAWIGSKVESNAGDAWDPAGAYEPVVNWNHDIVLSPFHVTNLDEIEKVSNHVDGHDLKDGNSSFVDHHEDVTEENSFPGEEIKDGVDTLLFLKVDIGNEVIIALHCPDVSDWTLEESVHGAKRL